MTPLVGLSSSELVHLAQEAGMPGYRGRQIAAWIYSKHAETFDQMTDLPMAIREQLAAEYVIGASRIAGEVQSPDGTTKYLLELRDGERIETVYLPYSDRVSVCVSSQAGCPAGCAFCATALGGLARNLTSGEIVDQVLTLARQRPNRRISHIVFMGMGEPLLNYEAVLRAVRLLTAEMGISARNITISTVGVVPGIRALAREGVPLTLAVSLHAPDDALRAQLVPTARKWPLEEILDACRQYHALTKRDLTFEYILLGGINDSTEQAAALADRLKGLPGNVNLIPFNHVETPQGFRPPSREAAREFRRTLEASGRLTTQRMQRGHAIAAACGQLRARTPARALAGGGAVERSGR